MTKRTKIGEYTFKKNFPEDYDEVVFDSNFTLSEFDKDLIKEKAKELLNSTAVEEEFSINSNDNNITFFIDSKTHPSIGRRKLIQIFVEQPIEEESNLVNAIISEKINNDFDLKNQLVELIKKTKPTANQKEHLYNGLLMILLKPESILLNDPEKNVLHKILLAYLTHIHSINEFDIKPDAKVIANIPQGIFDFLEAELS